MGTLEQPATPRPSTALAAAAAAVAAVETGSGRCDTAAESRSE